MSKLHIAVDALPAIPGKSGAIGAIRNMTRLVPQIDKSIELTLFVSPIQYEYYANYLSKGYDKNINLITIKIPKQALVSRIWAQNVIIPKLCHRLYIDILFSMNPEPVRKILGVKEAYKIVDLQYYDVPEEFGLLKTSYRKWMGKRKAARSEIIIANSLYTKSKIIEYFGTNPDRIHVVYEALDHDFFNTNQIDPQESTDFKKRYSINYPYIIYVSSFRPYKNHILLLTAFSNFKKRGLPHHLVLVGNDIRGYRKQVEKKAEEVGIMQNVHFFDFVHHWDLRHFYAAADLAVYPSELETFGIPPLEAMACGVPVIVSDRTAMPEISGGGSLVVDPHNEDLMAISMYQVLYNKDLNEEMKKRGIFWSRHFTWERSISETVKLMRDLVS